MEPNQAKEYERQYEHQVLIPANASDIFAFIDDHKRLASHMNKSSWMMGGGRMTTEVDSGLGQKVGSHIRMAGKVFGIAVSLDESIIEDAPPRLKVWETVGQPKLLVVDHYRMKAQIEPQTDGARLTVSIDYNRPKTSAWLGMIFGGFLRKMVCDENDSRHCGSFQGSEIQELIHQLWLPLKNATTLSCLAEPRGLKIQRVKAGSAKLKHKTIPTKTWKGKFNCFIIVPPIVVLSEHCGEER